MDCVARSPRARSFNERPRARLRALWPLFAALGSALFVLVSAADAQAYSWMIRHGQGNCSNCHADPSGGETLTLRGRMESARLLDMQYGEPKEGTPRSAGFLWGLIAPDDPVLGGGSRLLLGGSLRVLSVTEPATRDFSAFPMQLDAYGELKVGALRAGGSLGVARAKAGSPHIRAAQVTTNQGEEMNLISRTHYLGYDVSPGVLIRAGRLNLPFGVRVPEHVLWTREATQTDRESDQQHGLAVAFTTGALRGELMAIAGNYQVNPDDFRERGYSGFAEYFATPKLALGVSSLVTHAKADRLTNVAEETTRGAHGVFARAGVTRELVLLAELDLLHRSRRDLGYTGFIQADYELIQGLHLGATGELLSSGDEGRDASLGGWLSVIWHFLPHLDMRVDGLLRQGAEAQILTQLHAYL
ncbi:MAG: hypothetical protein KIT72_18805 [Polyangiaceae bacterium]|nr:hypothetical protein [Polyangiaceae bacterium]MCW5792470.1 hypothetical protein [Polyangiaceae bacterium]